MKLPVRSRTAMQLGNGLIAHVRTVQEHRKTHGKLPQRPYLTYTQLRDQSGASFALVGIGNFLDEVLDAIHAPDAPDALRGLTLFVTDKTGAIAYDTAKHDWRGINAMNAPQHRKDVLEQDWNNVEFIFRSKES